MNIDAKMLGKEVEILGSKYIISKTEQFSDGKVPVITLEEICYIGDNLPEFKIEIKKPTF